MERGPDLTLVEEIGCDFGSRGAGTRAAVVEGVRRLWIPLIVCLLSLSGVAVAADALVVTEREQLDGFIDDVTAAKVDARLDGALSYTNPSDVPCRLTIDGQARVYGAGEGTDFAEALRSALRVFDSDKQALLQQSVRVDGERARVTARVGDQSYEQTVIYELERGEDRWLVRSVRVL
jgi:hypothetical protein